MGNAIEETEKRLRIGENEIDRFREHSLGALIAGSVAYAPNLHVTEKSDIDLVIVVADVKDTLDLVIEDEKERAALKNRFFEGYCIKTEVEGIPTSTHILGEDALEIISRCFVANMRVYRNRAKGGSYILNGFEGNRYKYTIKDIRLTELNGVRTIVPISFIHNDRYFLGIRRDKLLCNPRIIQERGKHLSRRIDKLWTVVTQNLYDEAIHLYGRLDLRRMNVVNALAKKNKLSHEGVEGIKDKTRFYLRRIK